MKDEGHAPLLLCPAPHPRTLSGAVTQHRAAKHKKYIQVNSSSSLAGYLFIQARGDSSAAGSEEGGQNPA